ncbi:hypothetical protein HZ994_05430 [Akkermansiaceae bacterium]|nr:hypothetical protein HZ994_05430 [Akkermansiaceae bacterium]
MNIKPEDTKPKRTAMASTKADLRELRSNSQATVQEIQAFLRDLKGKSPQEMLGVVASNSLVRALFISAGVVAAVLLLFTAIPYFTADEKPDKPASENIPGNEQPEPGALPETPVPEAPPEPDPLSKLGVGEELAAPPGTNPLEDKGDDFLKDLE